MGTLPVVWSFCGTGAGAGAAETETGTPWKLKEEARQGTEADHPLEEEGWGAVRPITKKISSKQGTLLSGIAT